MPNEEYAVLSVSVALLKAIKENFTVDTDYTLHFIKENNLRFKEDEALKELYSKKSKISKEISKREQLIK